MTFNNSAISHIFSACHLILLPYLLATSQSLRWGILLCEILFNCKTWKQFTMSFSEDQFKAFEFHWCSWIWNVPNLKHISGSFDDIANTIQCKLYFRCMIMALDAIVPHIRCDCIESQWCHICNKRIFCAPNQIVETVFVVATNFSVYAWITFVCCGFFGQLSNTEKMSKT